MTRPADYFGRFIARRLGPDSTDAQIDAAVADALEQAHDRDPAAFRQLTEPWLQAGAEAAIEEHLRVTGGRPPTPPTSTVNRPRATTPTPSAPRPTHERTATDPATTSPARGGRGPHGKPAGPPTDPSTSAGVRPGLAIQSTQEP